MLRTWLDSWPGIGHVAVGMHRQGYDLQLTQYDDDRGWRATFYIDPSVILYPPSERGMSIDEVTDLLYHLPYRYG